MRISAWTSVALIVTTASLAAGQDVGFQSAWPELAPVDREHVMALGEDFKGFLGRAKSEMFFVKEGTTLLEAKGFRRWDPAVGQADLKPGSRWYAINRDRTIAAFVIGTDPLETGLRIVNTHIDSVRLEFKTKPFRESQQIALIDTQQHGGLKNYQWVNVPLAVIGRVDRADGTTAWIDVGNKPDDPVLLITDLAPHVDQAFRNRLQPGVILAEEMDPIIASLPPDGSAGQRSAVDRLLAMLQEKYTLTAKDFLSADLQIVPATMPRDVGWDRALIGAYGHDDRATAYLSLRAIVELGTPKHTSIAYMVNNEEVGSWNTGVSSEWFNTLVDEILAVQKGPAFNDLARRKTYANTQVLVSDCTTAQDPDFPQPQNPALTSRLGYGMVVKEYGAGREANSEFFAKMRGLFDREKVRWQTHSYDAGLGGGTIASWFAGQNMEVMDVGIGILSMHSTYDVSSKVDLWHLYRGFGAFFKSN